MSNSILTQDEITTVKYLITFLRNRDVNRLADRVERVLNNALAGYITRTAFKTSIIMDAAYRGIILAAREKNVHVVRDFESLLL